MTAPAAPLVVSADDLVAFVSRIFVAAGMAEEAAAKVADGLVEADLEGQPSHGVMLVDMYVDRLRAGSVSTAQAAAVVSDRGGCVVLDAGNAFGHLTAAQSIDIAVERAKEQGGVGLVAVRHGFHFGTARRYVLRAVEQDCIGIAMCNTRPLMPAPGGAERVVGNNPLAIAVPTDDDVPLVLDMATSEAAMGKIRLAEKAGQPIPATWAVQADGIPTLDAKQAIAGMLLPAAGAKGFGLALMIDLFCGLLSGGASGDGVKPLYGDPGIPYDCSHVFMAIDIAHFCEPSWFRAEAAATAGRIRSGKRAPGVFALFAPGEPEWRARQNANQTVSLNRAVARSLIKVADDLHISAAPLRAHSDDPSTEKR